MDRKIKLECDDFGGEGSEAYNALASALWRAASGRHNVYEYLEKTPKTSLVVEICQALNEIGYKIVPS